MKKQCLFFTFMLLSLLSKAQERFLLCNTKIDFYSDKSAIEVANGDLMVTLNWDVNKNDDINSEVILEIVSIKDCYKTSQAERFKNEINIKINAKDFMYKDKITLYHKEMGTKCFKYRFKTNNENCNESTPWFFFTFI